MKGKIAMNIKSFYFGITSVFMAIFFFCSCSATNTASYDVLSENIVDVVDGENISEKRLEERTLYANIFNESLLRTLKESNTEELFSKYKLAVDESIVTETLIQDAVIRRYLGNSSITFKDVSDSVDRETQTMEKEETSYFNNLIKVIDEHNISFEKYEEISKDYAYDLYNRQYLKQIFGEKWYKENIEQSFDEQFDEFLKKLIKKSNIKIP